MYRNAFRAELGLISLAAVKANIMISLNGLIISVLIISGGFIYNSSPLFVVPAAIFLFSSAASVFYALLAASPERRGGFGRIVRWAQAVMRRKATLRDFEAAVAPPGEFIEGQSNVLIYEDRSKLTKEEFQRQMALLSRDQDAVYASMNDQLFWLGEMAASKFAMLRRSYGVFRWGLVLSVLSILGIWLIYALGIREADPGPPSSTAVVSELDDRLEPSAGVRGHLLDADRRRGLVVLDTVTA